MNTSKKNIITLIGKTNTGKSTLFNNLIKEKKSIITKKKNTTIKSITCDLNNITIIDTPGPILKNSSKNINKIIYDSIKKSTTLLIVIDKIKLTTEDYFILELSKKYVQKKILLLNKIDELKKKLFLLNFINKINKKYKFFEEIIPISNKTQTNIDILIQKLKITNDKKHIPIKINYRSFITDLIRETLLNKLDKEIPYEINISILNNKLNKHTEVLSIKIKSKKYTQKKIIIGKNGEKIKEIINDIKRKAKKILKKIKKIDLIIN